MTNNVEQKCSLKCRKNKLTQSVKYLFIITGAVISTKIYKYHMSETSISEILLPKCVKHIICGNWEANAQ